MCYPADSQTLCEHACRGCALSMHRSCRLNSDPRSWNQTQISFSRKEVAKALDIYQIHFVIVQVSALRRRAR